MQKGNYKPKPSLEQIKAEIGARARAIYLKRQETKEPGNDLSDWLQAEKGIKRKYRFS